MFMGAIVPFTLVGTAAGAYTYLSVGSDVWEIGVNIGIAMYAFYRMQAINTHAAVSRVRFLRKIMGMPRPLFATYAAYFVAVAIIMSFSASSKSHPELIEEAVRMHANGVSLLAAFFAALAGWYFRPKLQQ